MKYCHLLILGSLSGFYQIKLSSDPITSSAPPPPKKGGPLPYGDYFKADYDKFAGTTGFAPEYTRDMPEQFSDLHKDDMFMNSMISNYSKEGRNPDGTKNGKFYVDREMGKKAAREVLNTHLKLSGKALDDYMTMNFDEKWNYWDVNHEDLIEADRMSTFFRDLCHDANLNI